MSGATRNPPLFTTPLTVPPDDVVRRQFFLPHDPVWLGLFGGAVSMLFNEDNWQQSEGGLSIEDTIQVYLEVWAGKVDNFMIGSVVSTTRFPLPDYMLLCDGANFSGDDFPALYAVIDDAFKLGDGTFVVPNLQGRFVLGELPEDVIEGIEFSISNIGGEYNHTLTVDELATHAHTSPDHNHTQNAHNHTQASHLHGVPSVNSGAIGNNAILLRSNAASGINTNTNSQTPVIDNATATNQATAVTIETEGDSEPHNNIPPYLVLRYAIICR